MPIPKKKPITKREIEIYDVTVDSEDVSTKSSKANDEYFDYEKQNTHPTSSIDKFENDELFNDSDDFENKTNDNNSVNNSENTSNNENNTKEKNITEISEIEYDVSAQTNNDNCYPQCNFFGYNITSLSANELLTIKASRLDDVIVSNFCLVKKVTDDYFENDSSNYTFRKEWGFPYTGIYIGCILNCYKSKKTDGEYYVEFLANNFDVCLFKFTTSFRDPVYIELQNSKKFKNTIFKEVDITDIYGHWVYISVENVRLKNGSIFSKITNFNFLDRKVYDIIIKLADDMARQ